MAEPCLGGCRRLLRTCARGVYRRPLRVLMKWVFSAFVVLWNLRAIEGPASADLWPNDVFTKITPGKSLALTYPPKSTHLIELFGTAGRTLRTTGAPRADGSSC
jgi:hypothetical protein